MAKKNKPLKTGRFTLDEQKYIRQNMGTMTPEAMALALNRRKENIVKFIRKESTIEKQPAEIVAETKKGKAWDQLDKEFTAQEIKCIGQEYEKLITQFHDNITPSEENQLLDICKIMQLISRVHIYSKKTIDRMNEIEDALDEFKARNPNFASDDVQLGIFRDLNEELTSLQKTLKTNTDDFTKLQKEKENILKSLKVTRDQRLQRISESGKFLQLLEELRHHKNQEQESRHVELMRRAKERAKKKLSEPHTYVTGEVDIPLLTPELVENADSGED